MSILQFHGIIFLQPTNVGTAEVWNLQQFSLQFYTFRKPSCVWGEHQTSCGERQKIQKLQRSKSGFLRCSHLKDMDITKHDCVCGAPKRTQAENNKKDKSSDASTLKNL